MVVALDTGTAKHCHSTGSEPSEVGNTGHGNHFINIVSGEGESRARPRPRTDLRHISDSMVAHRCYNYAGAQQRVPSGLNIEAWKRYLRDYDDQKLVGFLEWGWPINFNRAAVLSSTLVNHGSALQHEQDIAQHIETKLAHGALLGPFGGPQ